MLEAGIREAPLSERVGKNQAYFNQYFGRGSPKYLPEDVREELGGIFRVHPDSFKTGRRITRPKRSALMLKPAERPVGRVVESGAALGPGNSTVLILRLDGGQELTIEVDRQAIDALKENLAALEPHARQPS